MAAVEVKAVHFILYGAVGYVAAKILRAGLRGWFNVAV